MLEIGSGIFSTPIAFFLLGFYFCLQSNGEDQMTEKMRIMSERPLNAETPGKFLRSWITPNSIFFDRNQGSVPGRISLGKWKLTVEGEVERPGVFGFEQIQRMPRNVVGNTLECSGNGRSLLGTSASGNPWTIGGVGNAIWGGVWLKDILTLTGLGANARHVAFEGFEKPLGTSGVKFIRSIPIEKALASTLLAYEMNGEPMPLKHGFPLRGLVLGWTGANSVKWLTRIMVLDRPYEGHYMDRAYRVYQKGQDPQTGQVVKSLKLKAIITSPLPGETVTAGPVVISGVAYGGEIEVERVEISADGGKSWAQAEFIGPRERWSWRLWQYVLDANIEGEATLMALAVGSDGSRQPMHAEWNVLGYGNNGVHEHAIKVKILSR
jgi:DMSO/TMAO reductase YedYZ molybdopterin-dependent catalytic subunit